MLQAALQAANIVPDDRTMYNTDDIADAIKEAYGAEPTIRCANREEEGRKLLDSVRHLFFSGPLPELQRQHLLVHAYAKHMYAGLQSFQAYLRKLDKTLHGAWHAQRMSEISAMKSLGSPSLSFAD